MKGFMRVSVAGLGLGLAAALIGTGVASADPVVPAGSNAYDRPLQGEGSDTTEGVMNGLAETLTNATGGKLIASYNAVGATGFTTKGGANPAPAPVNGGPASNCTFQGNPGSAGNVGDPANVTASTYVQGDRANGSGNGISALNDSWLNNNQATGASTATHGCLDFARSSAVKGAKTVGMTYVPFAQDAVAFAVTGSSNLPRQLSKADLTAMYNCTYPGFDNAVISGGAVTTPSTYHALIPQAGSGTRGFFLSALGISDPGTTVSTSTACLSDQKTRSGLGGTNYIEEHKGNVLDDNSIVPISVAQFISQSEGVIADVRGKAVLGTTVNDSNAPTQFSLPLSLNNTYGSTAANPVTLSRQVYNVIPTQVWNTAAGNAYADQVKSVFTASGPNSSTQGVCSTSAQAVIQKYGFGLISNCGQVVAANQTAGQ